VAYVAASRARHRTAIHIVADSLDQAVEDLSREWSADRRPPWAIDTGTPSTRAQLAINKQTKQQLQASIDLAGERKRSAVAARPSTPASATSVLVPEVAPDRGLGF
jgi:hypothetical protein